MTNVPPSPETRTPSTEMRGPATDTFEERRQYERRPERQTVRETKPSFLTTEFWFALGGVAALIVTYWVAADTSFDLFRMCLLCVLLGMAYIASRGIAKSGTRTRRERVDD
jgi:hypothetical protein